MVTLMVLTSTPTPCGSSDGESFHPEAQTRRERAFPVRICARCEVKDACLEYALDANASGIWGGTTEANRKRILKERRTA